MILLCGVFLLFGGFYEFIFHLIEQTCINAYARNSKSNLRWMTLPAEISAFIKLPLLLLVVSYVSMQLITDHTWLQLFVLYCMLMGGKYLIGEYCKSL